MFKIFNIVFCVFLFNQFLYSQTLGEIERLKKEYEKALSRQEMQKPRSVREAENNANSTALPDKLIYSRKDVQSLLVNTQRLLDELNSIKDTVEKLPYAGYDIFTTRDSIPFWQNLPLPSNYILGPGDEIIISLWGEVESYDSEKINREGQLFIKDIGLMNLGGKSLNSAKTYVLSRYSKKYSTLIGSSPKSFIDVSVGELKSLNVHFVGSVNIPGVHLIHPFSNVVSGLIQSGGVKNTGSLRNIQIFRENKLLTTIDLYDYIFLGKKTSDIRLIDQDVVFIPPRTSTMVISGRIRSPGYFELKSNETINDLVKYSSGFDTRSMPSFFLYRYEDSFIRAFLVNRSNMGNFELISGDSIHIPIADKIDPYVLVDGQIKNPGKYPYQKNMSIKTLFESTSSTKYEDFFNTIDLSKVKVFRKNSNGSNIESITINYYKQSTFKLKSGDHLTFSPKKYFKPIGSVKITGEISSPGTYPVNNSTTLKELMNMSGGYTENALQNGVEIFRDSLKIAWDNDSFTLNHNDSLNVLKKTGLVQVKGEVNSPGYFSYNRKYSIKKYLQKAGGFSAFAERRDVYVVYPNGVSRPYSRWSKPKIIEGSTIFVMPRSLSGFSRGPQGWEAFAIVAGQAGNIATTLLSIAILANQTSGQ